MIKLHETLYTAKLCHLGSSNQTRWEQLTEMRERKTMSACITRVWVEKLILQLLNSQLLSRESILSLFRWVVGVSFLKFYYLENFSKFIELRLWELYKWFEEHHWICFIKSKFWFGVKPLLINHGEMKYYFGFKRCLNWPITSSKKGKDEQKLSKLFIVRKCLITHVTHAN